MNEKLKLLLRELRIDGNLRTRLNKIFDKEEPVTSIDFRGYEHSKKLQVNKDDLQAVLSICQAIPTLQSLTILGDELDDESATVLGPGIEQINQLSSFNIDSSNIGDAGAATLLRTIQMHNSITSFCLNGNNISNVTATAMEESVRKNEKILQISIQGNYIDDDGVISILNLLSLGRLEQIVIIGKSVGSKVCEEIGKKLATDNKLTGFVLEVDHVENIEVILDGIRINSFLTNIIFIGHNLDTAKQSEIEQQLEGIILRNTQGIYQRVISDIKVNVIECICRKLGLQTRLLDDAGLEKIIPMMIPVSGNVSPMSFFSSKGQREQPQPGTTAHDEKPIYTK